MLVPASMLCPGIDTIPPSREKVSGGGSAVAVSKTRQWRPSPPHRDRHRTPKQHWPVRVLLVAGTLAVTARSGSDGSNPPDTESNATDTDVSEAGASEQGGTAFGGHVARGTIPRTGIARIRRRDPSQPGPNRGTYVVLARWQRAAAGCLIVAITGTFRSTAAK